MGRVIKIWEASSGEEASILQGHQERIACLEFHPDGELLASASLDKTVRIWNWRTGKLVSVIEDHTEPVTGLSYSPDGLLLATGSWDKSAVIRDAKSGRARYKLVGHTLPVTKVAFSRDGKYVATLGSVANLVRRPLPSEVKLWDSATGKEITEFQGRFPAIFCLDFSLDGKSLIIGGSPGLWTRSAKTGKQLSPRMRDDVQAITLGMAFSPSGKRLVSASSNKILKVWDTVTGYETLVLRGHTDWVWDVAFSKDGNRIASASSDGTLRIWDATPLSTHQSAENGVAE
jgi:WD40 repeat protein